MAQRFTSEYGGLRCPRLQHHLIDKGTLVKNTVCYCFEYTTDDIKRDYIANGRSTIEEKIQAEKMLGHCQCAAKNPKGT